MENVPAMREQLGPDYARRIARTAHGIGYNVRYFLLNAAWYGVPQHRWRLFFVGIRSDLGVLAIPRPPRRTHQATGTLEGVTLPEDPWLLTGADVPAVDQPLPAVTVKQVLQDLPRLRQHLRGAAPSTDERRPVRPNASEWVQRLRAWPGVPCPETVAGNWYRNTPRDFPIFAEMAQGDRYPEVIRIAHGLLEEHLRTIPDPPRPGTDEWERLKARFVPPYRNDAFHDKWRKLIADEPSWTVTAHLSKDTYSHIHYDSRQARMITIREAARLQSFPDGVEFCGNFGDQFRQIGNAVPPILARAIAEQLLEQLRECTALEQTRAVS